MWVSSSLWRFAVFGADAQIEESLVDGNEVPEGIGRLIV